MRAFCGGWLRSVAVAIALSGMGQSAARADSTVVAELFTSQGCSSCPSADRLLTQLALRPGVIALSLNVDYWDYLGWKDDLARPENTTRQRAYARRMKSRNIYTPQLVVEGKMDVVGNREAQVEAAIRAYINDEDEADVTVAPLGGTRYSVTAAPLVRAPKEDIVVWLVGYDRLAERDVKRGENGGRKLRYSNVVRDWREVARWDGAAALRLAFERPDGKDGCVVIFQEGGVGRVLGAANVIY